MVPPVWGWYVPNSNYSSSWTLKMELLVVGRTILRSSRYYMTSQYVVVVAPSRSLQRNPFDAKVLG